MAAVASANGEHRYVVVVDAKRRVNDVTGIIRNQAEIIIGSLT